MKWPLSKGSLYVLTSVSVTVGLIAWATKPSWVEVVIGALFYCVGILLMERAGVFKQQKSKTESTVASTKSHAPDDNRNQSARLNAAGKALVAQERRKFFRTLKMIAVFALFSLLGGGTVSGLWFGLLNRCSACGKYDAEKAHRVPVRPKSGAIYNCQPAQMKQFFGPYPRQDAPGPPRDDR